MHALTRYFFLMLLAAGVLIGADENPKRDEKPKKDEKFVTMDEISPFDPKPLMKKVEERIKTDKYRFAVLGDTKHATQFPALVKLIDEQYVPDFVLTTGDMVQAGGGKIGPGFWEKLSMDTGAAMQKRPWWPAIGNHEIAGSPIVLRKELNDDDVLKQNQKVGTENFLKFYNLEREYYSFTFRNAVFIALPFKYPKGASEKWLKAELEAARAAKKHIFVFNHAPFYTVGGKSKMEIENKETSVTKMFQENGVLGVFSGHDHGYYRTVRGGIPYVISAGGGAKIYPAMRLKEALPEDVYYFGEPESAKGNPLPEGIKVVELQPLAKQAPVVATPPEPTPFVEPKVESKFPEAPKRKQYFLYHSGVTGVSRITDQVDLFSVIIDVDGPKVTMKCVSVRGEIFDEMEMAK